MRQNLHHKHAGEARGQAASGMVGLALLADSDLCCCLLKRRDQPPIRTRPAWLPMTYPASGTHIEGQAGLRAGGSPKAIPAHHDGVSTKTVKYADKVASVCV